jgi:hypothetical protein
MKVRLREWALDGGIAVAIVLMVLACLMVTARDVRADQTCGDPPCGGGGLVSCSAGNPTCLQNTTENDCTGVVHSCNSDPTNCRCKWIVQSSTQAACKCQNFSGN